ncbi:MAG: ADP-ribosylglycohydrolase family protein [Candidatus Bathyarchaeota archaeon]|nr:ADP-ribosylglycohydrolase family protein [Candidatus Bathyarchaeota archaeon]
MTESGDEPTLNRLFLGWKKYVVDNKDKIWSGVSERASMENAAKGLTAPTTGNDNPHHFDDGAVARAVPIGLKYHHKPELAAEVAGRMASITNAEDGIFAAIIECNLIVRETTRLLREGRCEKEVKSALTDVQSEFYSKQN